MTLTLEEIAKAVGLILVLIGIYAAWRARVKREINNERDILELRQKIQENKDRIDQLDEHYKEMVDRLYDNLFPKRQK
jgi:cbb3-type cytochrome oxidase subunit 3